MFRSFLAFALLLFSISSCGYHLGVSPPAEMEGVNRIHLKIPDNRTQYTRLEALFYNHLSDAFVQDGRYHQAPIDSADATIETEIKTVSYSQIRSQRTDVLAPEELRMDVTVSWKVLRLDNKQTTLMSGISTGSTRFFIDDNLQTAQENAFPDALARVSRKIVSKLSNSL